MKEIKAYVRKAKAEEVVCALEAVGVPGFTIIQVMALGAACVPEDETLSIDFAEPVSDVTKLEVVCSDDDLDKIVKVIKDAAYTGHCGDGMIYVSDISGAYKIRNDECGVEALISTRGDQ